MELGSPSASASMPSEMRLSRYNWRMKACLAWPAGSGPAASRRTRSMDSELSRVMAMASTLYQATPAMGDVLGPGSFPAGGGQGVPEPGLGLDGGYPRSP